MNLLLSIPLKKKITVFFLIGLMFCFNLCGSMAYAGYSDVSNAANTHSGHDSHGSHVNSCVNHQLSFEKSDNISKSTLSSVSDFLFLQEQDELDDLFTSGKKYDLLFLSIPSLSSGILPIHDRAPPIGSLSI